MSIVREDGALDLYDGLLRAKDPDGKIIFDMVKPMDYLDYIREEVRSWSYMKFPYIHSLGKEKGWYRVGPLARVNNCDFIDSPLAEKERQEFVELLDDPDLQKDDLVVTGRHRNETVALLEAPRGTLFHHYKIDDNDQVEMANLIVSTTSNNEPMNQAVKRIADDFLAGQEITEGLLNHVEVAIRAYDPCLSCATHAVGQMPLEVSLFDKEGREISKKAKN